MREVLANLVGIPCPLEALALPYLPEHTEIEGGECPILIVGQQHPVPGWGRQGVLA
jgi:hypothetical protein